MGFLNILKRKPKNNEEFIKRERELHERKLAKYEEELERLRQERLKEEAKRLADEKEEKENLKKVINSKPKPKLSKSKQVIKTFNEINKGLDTAGKIIQATPMYRQPPRRTRPVTPSYQFDASDMSGYLEAHFNPYSQPRSVKKKQKKKVQKGVSWADYFNQY